MVKNNMILKMFLDLIALIIISFPLLAIKLWASPYERGFFYDDSSLALPYKDQTISEALLAGLGFALMVATILIVEIIRGVKGKSVRDKYLCGSEIPGWVWESYTAIGVFTFGAACQQLIVTVAKYVIGRLRPHFYDLCVPVPTSMEQVERDLGYVQNFTCTGPLANHNTMLDMRLSFPSAHSGFAMYCAIFFIMYIQVNAKWRGSKLMRHVAQFIIFLAAWYVGLSRVTDHMHHWSDVAVGFAAGAAFAIITFVYIYKPKKYLARDSYETERTSQPEFLPRPVLMRT
ncbi:putative phosphatidate phosphatase [Leptidea sinapis]|uniref:putative phosphatidate phosphatase n=1 Tax=Leptidea sinapis TaxID=189913 RepID=UPI00211FB240|nr:putative phosphatidate phosphatase [Leptidea sinapis]XP_050682694.1 putative phosphatidate phosphatase [Leptidea sinapis]